MGPKTRGGMVRRSRRSQGLEAETEFIEITRKSTKMRKLNKGKEVAIEEENIEIRQESADEVPTKVSEDVNEADGDGDGDDPHVEIEVENVIAEEQSQSENGVTEEPSQPREADMEAENGVTQEPSQPREADMEPENGFTQEPSQSREADMEPENGVTQEPSQPREASKGMDKKYMRSSCWSLHGERRSDMNDSVPQSETEAYGLLRTAYFDSGEPDEPPSDDTGGEPVHGEPDEDSEFRKN
ncbi:paternally-expressed gene 3 protein-like [Brassica napus]|uniref:paternally-expressed gene 3 protein-like n=1 Tax=Brassica napus TaxID=3708 RepID=UPI0020790CBA|nr:paternally-expressed gene 3 protein-like [Brassica napus]